MSFKIPILLITFNRSDCVRQSLGEIRKQQPSRLYVFQDGARPDRPEDVDKCEAVRDVVNELVDWPCELHTNYQEKNLGCGPGPYTAISWFFENEEYGIILEDDILPHPLFFSYCDELLRKYANENKVGMVTAHNLRRAYSRRHSYYFSNQMNGTLGWGTWRRVWKDFDFNIQYDRDLLDEKLKSCYKMPYNIRERQHRFYKTCLGKERNDCWDIQFDYYLLINGYLNVKANSCLTSHEGDGPDATHSGYTNLDYKMEVNESLFKVLDHPNSVEIDFSDLKRMYKKSLKILIKKIIRK